MRVTRVRAFRTKGETEITIRVTGEEAESICHALHKFRGASIYKLPGVANGLYPRLVAKGYLRLYKLLHDAMWNAWGTRLATTPEYKQDVDEYTRSDLSDIKEWKL